ncbi:MAG: AsmA-like C-terminal region-containing protein [Geminicoccaceae bacterium]|nr:AsmA-like C-terminal region-containing protein [Geminicoccaceae bacterium]MDW8340928.1 AsmA-like C-terminal region-containing protein [Geminicoccaceae bacterium]
MRRIALAAVILAVGLAAAVAGLGALFGPRFLAPRLERAASRALGAPVAIEGGLSFNWSLSPTLAVERLRIGSEPDSHEPLSARIERLEARLALAALVRGAVAFEEVRVADATIRLAAADPTTPTKAEPTHAAAPAGGALASLRLERLRAERLHLELPRPGARPPLSIEVADLDVSLPDPDGRADIEASGSLEGVPWTLRLGVRSPNALFERAPVRFEPLAVRLGEDDLRGRLEFDPGGPRPRLAGRLESRRLAPARLAALLAGPEETRPVRPEERGERSAIPDRPIEPALLRDFALALELAVDELRLDGGTLRDVRASVELGNGRLELPLRARLAKGALEGRAVLDGGTPEPSLALDLALRGAAAGELQRIVGLQPSVEAPLDATLSLAGRGSTTRALVASLEGRLTGALGSGRIALALLDRLAGGVRELLRALVAREQGDWVPLRCAVVDLPVRAGVVETRLALLETEAARLVVEGRVDLARERLDLLLVPRARAATLGLAVPVRVRGTLVEPRFALDEREAARRAALGVLGALVFPPAALAAFADLGVADNPCLGSRGPAGREEPRPAPAPPGTDLLRRGLEGFFGR